MAKTLEQIVLEGLAGDCCSLEELFVLWQTTQILEEHASGNTCYEEIDKRSFHVDGMICPERYSGVLYILKEPSLKHYIQKGLTFPVLTDVRRDYRNYRRGYDDERGYLTGMQRLLLGEAGEKLSADKVMETLGVMYINKRGGKEVSDSIWMNYGYEYIEFIKQEVHLLAPKVIVCGGEEIFKMIVKEVFRNKKTIRNRGEHMIWKGTAQDYQFAADRNYRHTGDPDKTAVVVVNMWNPAYRMNKEQYLSPEEYLAEFHRRITGVDAVGIKESVRKLKK